MGDATYTNPVSAGSFPDPFVLRYDGAYWAYATGEWTDGRCFGILRSHDLVTWTDVGGAMEPLPDRPPFYWAPEVTYDNGRFYLYYSAGDEVHMHLRVAVADRPEGPYVDVGRRLTSEEFAIDAHVFVDADGARYMFYATDFLSHSHVGTGTVVDRMIDPFTLEGRPRPVTRARFDWQVYDPARAEKGGVRWHTVEGPFVLARKGRYYEMFSGGNWQNVTYGVSYATSDRVLSSGEWHQTCDGSTVLPILRTIPERVIGPGHNSVVLGPDSRQLFCVYHRWTPDGRALSIDRLEFVGERLAVLGPTDEPTPAPILAGVNGFEDSMWDRSRGAWRLNGEWASVDARDESAAAVLDIGASGFVVEVGLRWAPGSPARGTAGVELRAGDAVVLTLAIDRADHAVTLRWNSSNQVERMPLSGDFDALAVHAMRLEVDGTRAVATLDGGAAAWSADVGVEPDRLALVVAGASVVFSGVSVSRGWQNDFEADGSLADHGWRARSGQWRIVDGELRVDGRGRVAKSVAVEAYELVVNARSPDLAIGPAYDRERSGPVFALVNGTDGWALEGGGVSFVLGAAFDPRDVNQFRFRNRGGRLAVAHEGRLLGEIDAPSDVVAVELGAGDDGAAFEHVRLSELPPPDGTV